MKKLKEPGGNISLKTKKNEDPAIMQWLNAQTNLMDSIRYLIENEVRQNGIRNLQAIIPAERAFGATAVENVSATYTNAAMVAAVIDNRELAAGVETGIAGVDISASPESPAVQPTAASPATQVVEPVAEAVQVQAEVEAEAVPNEAAQPEIEDDIDDDDIESWT